MSVKQDLTDHRAETADVEAPEAAFLRLLAAEQGLPDPAEDAPAADPEPKPNPDDTGESDEELEDEQESAEEESDDPDEESDDLPEPDTEEPVAEDVHEVTVNGETVQVSYDELLGGYSREADYTRRTQEMSVEQQQLAADREAVLAERQKYDGLLGQLQEVVEQSLPKEPDWTAVREQTPDQFPAIYAEWTQRKGQLEKITAERERVAQAAATDLANAADEQTVVEQKKLREALPALFDAETSNDLSQAMLQTAQDMGYTQEDVGAIRDSRAFRLLHDATQYRLLQQKGKKVVSKTRTKATRTVRPGAKKAQPGGRAKRRHQAESRLKKSGSVEDAASVFLPGLTKRA